MSLTLHANAVRRLQRFLEPLTKDPVDGPGAAACLALLSPPRRARRKNDERKAKRAKKEERRDQKRCFHAGIALSRRSRRQRRNLTRKGLPT